MADEPNHDGVVPLFGPVAEQVAGAHRRHKNREDKRTNQRKADGPCHWFEESTFDSLQGEDGQIGGNDDAAGKEDRSLNFMGRLADLLRRGSGVVRVSKMTNHVFDHHHGSVDDHAEVERTQRQ